MKVVWLLFCAALVLACSSPDQGGKRATKPAAGGNSSTADGGTSGTSGTKGKTCGDVVCDPNATCAGVGSAVKCACVAGFQGDGKSCADIDECADRTANDCDPNASCTNRPGSYLCACKDGFVGDGKKCSGVNECQGAENTCDPNAVCADANPGFSCTCKAGFTGDGKVGCADVNECATPNAFSCAANAHCANTFGSYDCACDPAFSGDGNKACQALCDAAKTDSSVCGEHGLCRVNGLQAVCDACAAGFTGDGKTCSSASNCGAACDGAGTDDDAHAVCGPGGKCACAPGYGGSVGSCTDVDECATGNGGCDTNEACTNTPGGHACTCKAGFARDTTGTCVDIDECQATPGPCPPDATCTNKTMDDSGRGFTCACKDGFTGDGTICTDIDECAKNNGGCTANATCQNQRGSFACACVAPLAGDGTNCHCDLSGLWAMRQDLDTCWKGRPIIAGADQDVVSAGSVEATVWELHEFTYDGTTLKERRKGCGSDNTPDLISPLFQETYSSYAPLDAFDGVPLQGNDTFAAKGLIPGSSLVTPSSAAVIGIDLGNDPLHAPWPAAHGDVTTAQWTDPDNDGEPGFTFWPRVPSQITDTGASQYSYLPVRPAVQDSTSTLYIDQRAGCVSVAARVVTHLEATVESCTRITGKVVNEKSEGRVHSCTLVDKGTCEAPPSNQCTGWNKDVTCTRDDWAHATRCADDDIGRLDDDENQAQDSQATFELVKIGNLGDGLDCAAVRTKLPAIARTTPTITCTTPK